MLKQEYQYSSELMAIRVAACVGFAGAVVCIFTAARIARADWVRRDNTEAQILRAIAMEPENWAFYRDLAELKPERAVERLRRAVELNPRNSSLRIELGEYAEKAGDYATAEQSFRSAVVLDRTFAPRGIQAGFYFRRGDRAEFLKAVRAALQEIGVEDARPLFENCWALLGDGDAIWKDAIPDRVEVLRSYLTFLFDTGRGEAARPVAGRLMARKDGGEESREALLGYCDGMLAAGNMGESVRAWEWLGGRVAFGGLTVNRGFDWRYADGEGLYYEVGKSSADKAGGLRITFTGKQAEDREVLWRYIAFAGAGEKYRLREKSRTPAGGESGLRWEVIAGGKDLLKGAGGLSGDGERTFEFTGPSEAGLGRLSLRYERVKGTVRLEGEAEIRSAELVRE